MREFILKYKEPFTIQQLIYDWPDKPVFENLLVETLGELVVEGKVSSLGPGYNGRTFYEVVK